MKTLYLLILALLFPQISSAETNREAKILGWSGTDLFVGVEERGKTENEEGIPVDYNVETISIYPKTMSKKTPSSGAPVFQLLENKPTKSYILTSKGRLPRSFKDARSEKPVLDNLTGVRKGALSKSRVFSVSMFTSKSIERKSKKARCVFSHYVRLFDKVQKRVFNVISFQEQGEFESGRFPDCPQSNYKVYWSDDDQSFAVMNRKGKISAYNFSLETVRKNAPALPVKNYENPIFSEAWLIKDPLWLAIIRGEQFALKEAAKRKDQVGKLGYSLLQIQNEKVSRGIKKAKKASKKMKKSILNYTIAAAVFREAGKTRDVTRIMDKIVKKATVDELIRSADFFMFFDLDIAAQLYVVALSSKKIKEENKIAVYKSLLRCLLDSGNMSAAKEVVERVKELKGDLGIQGLRYRILRREPDILSDIQHFVQVNPTHCDGYLALGRAFGYKRSKEAMNQYLTATQCDPNSSEAIYLLGELYKRAGNRAEAIILFRQYGKVAKARKGDVVRDARRQYAHEITHPKKSEPVIETPSK